MSTREIVYGRNPVAEVLTAKRRRVHDVWALDDLVGEPWLAGFDVRPATKEQIARSAGTGDHQGVVAFCDPYPYVEGSELIKAPGIVVALDGAQDPRNLGAIARVCDAAGAAGLAIMRRGSPGVTSVVCKASAGAIEHLPVAQVENLAAFLNDAKGPDRWVIGTDADSGEDFRDVDLGDSPVFVFGAEGTGLRPRVRSMCDVLLRIPMKGHVTSLNLSVAAGILLFESLRAEKPC
jgi:23S rRNA (guanosine2251-2'-O)-methyltransferase